MSHFKAKMHQIRFFDSDPAGGSLLRSPNAVDGLRGPTSLREGRGRREGECLTSAWMGDKRP